MRLQFPSASPSYYDLVSVFPWSTPSETELAVPFLWRPLYHLFWKLYITLIFLWPCPYTCPFLLHLLLDVFDKVTNYFFFNYSPSPSLLSWHCPISTSHSTSQTVNAHSFYFLTLNIASFDLFCCCCLFVIVFFPFAYWRLGWRRE